MKQIDRIKKMESIYDGSRKALDAMLEALEEYEKAQKDFRKLCDYYGSSLWMKDYEDDEAGKLPSDLKRGVLSEDLVYDLIREDHDLNARMLKIISDRFTEGC